MIKVIKLGKFRCFLQLYLLFKHLMHGDQTVAKKSHVDGHFLENLDIRWEKTALTILPLTLDVIYLITFL